MAVLSLISITLGTIAQSKVETDPVFTLLVQIFIAFVVFAVVVAFHGIDFEFNVYSTTGWIWMGAVVSVIGFLFLLRLLKNSSAEKVSILFLLLPLLTMVLESIFFGTHLTLMTIAGDVIVVAVLAVYQFKPFGLSKSK